MVSSNNYEVKNWADIRNEFEDATLIIGNGTSIAIDECFKLFSLKKVAEEKEWIDEKLNQLFTEFDTKNEGNFELILQFIWHAKLVNDYLEVDNEVVTRAYETVKNALIKSVREGHCNYSTAHSYFPFIYTFTSLFKNIVSLNYDLILYWSIMYGNEQDDGHEFSDCLVKNRGEQYITLKKDLDFLRKSYQPYRRSQKTRYIDRKTLVFYPHGNLILLKDIHHQEIKLEKGADSLKRIEDKWQTNQFIPIFVSEGTTEQKKYAINQSRYLSFIYDDVLPQLHEHEIQLVIIGWSLGDQDRHILEQIIGGRKNSKKKGRIAIGIRRSSMEKNCQKFIEKIKKLNSEVKITFFDSQSSGCWNNP